MAEASDAAVNSDVKVKKSALEKAIRAILQVVAKKSANANPLFAEAAETIYIQLALAKIPEKPGKTTMIPLPHPLYGEKAEACFISKTPQKKYKELLLQKHTVPGLTKVIGVEKLRKKYKDLAQKRTLADAFDLFLCDKRVIEMMPQILGNVFYKHKLKAPVPVPLKENGEDPAKEIRKAIGGTKFRVVQGRSVGVRFGRCSMAEEELFANAKAVISASIKLLGSRGLLLQAITIQATNTIALPIWRRVAPGEGAPVNLKKWREQNASSAASDTGASGISDSEITGSEIISDAGETLSTRDSMSEVETAGETMSEVDPSGESLSEMGSESEVVTKEDLPLVQGLKKKKRKRMATNA